MKIILELDGHAPDTRHDIGLLLRDALWDFRRLRTPADAYVHERYSGNPNLDTPDKVRHVEERVALALLLARADVRVEHEDDS